MFRLFLGKRLIVKLAIITSIIFIIVGFIGCVLSLGVDDQSYRLRQIIMLVLYVFIISYFVFSYKIAHGNLLKILFILFDLFLISDLNNSICKIVNNGTFAIEYQLPVVAQVFSIFFIASLAGRLNKLKENIIVSSCVFVLFILEFVFAIINKSITTNFVGIVSALTPLIVFVVLCSSYVARYDEHKKSGQLEK